MDSRPRTQQPDLGPLWAKTGSEGAWHPLAAHLVDATLVAVELWANWIAPATRRWLAEPLRDERRAGALLALLAGCHDLGKASPAFQVQVDALAEGVRAVGFPLPRWLPSRAKAPHALVSATSISAILDQRGWTREARDAMAAILGGHHGWFPAEGYANEAAKRPELHGYSSDHDDPWMTARARLFEHVAEIADAKEVIAEAAGVDIGSARSLTLAGFVVLADWIASNASLFPYSSAPYASDYDEISHERAERALGTIGWHRGAFATPTGARWFAERFGFAPNALQCQAIEASARCGPGLVLVEAPMGNGKTEAAFAIAETLARAHGFEGIFVGLPTQATSNQMFGRTRTWLEGAAMGTAVVELAHGRARQVAEYRALTGSGSPSCVDLDGEESAVVVAQAWFAGPKRRLLAPFVVGTIDQALLCAAKVRHVALRQVGLAGKVVVIDEVHAYDAHMSVFLRRALRWLGEAEVPVVLLSATLPPAARSRLVGAYVGRDVELSGVSYPSVTTVSVSGHVVSSPVPAEAPPTSVQIEWLDEGPDDTAFAGLCAEVAAMARAGANVLVVRNTVARAQATYRQLVGRVGPGSVHLLHARYRAADRIAKEAWLTRAFGRGGERPSGEVVVGTQVLEQSLDVDFDVLVTDLAPIDLVFQRVGRIHRHADVTRPTGFGRPRVLLAGSHADGVAGPSFPLGSIRVYGEHLLLRSAAVLAGRAALAVPDDIGELVAAVYGEKDIVPQTWSARSAPAEAEHRANERARERRAESYAIPAPEGAGSLLELCRIGLGDPDDDDPEVQAAVRDAPVSLEAVLAFPGASDGNVRCGPMDVPLCSLPSPDQVDAVLGACLRLPPALTQAVLGVPVPSGWKLHPWIRDRRIVALRADGSGVVGGYRVFYDEDVGLEVEGRGD